jgi:hypothetical protein
MSRSKKEFVKRAVPKLLAWAELHDSHGLILTGMVWLPEGDEPEPERSMDFVRVPQFDVASGFYDKKRIEGW